MQASPPPQEHQDKKERLSMLRKMGEEVIAKIKEASPDENFAKLQANLQERKTESGEVLRIFELPKEEENNMEKLEEYGGAWTDFLDYGMEYRAHPPIQYRELSSQEKDEKLISILTTCKNSKDFYTLLIENRLVFRLIPEKKPVDNDVLGADGRNERRFYVFFLQDLILEKKCYNRRLKLDCVYDVLEACLSSSSNTKEILENLIPALVKEEKWPQSIKNILLDELWSRFQDQRRKFESFISFDKPLYAHLCADAEGKMSVKQEKLPKFVQEIWKSISDDLRSLAKAGDNVYTGILKMIQKSPAGVDIKNENIEKTETQKLLSMLDNLSGREFQNLRYDFVKKLLTEINSEIIIPEFVGWKDKTRQYNIESEWTMNYYVAE